jgi:L-lactate dehydrogenase complex protein LldF
MTYKRVFLRKSDKVAFNLLHRKIIKFNIGKYDFAVKNGIARFIDFEKCKEICGYKKEIVLKNWDYYIKQFIIINRKKGVKVFVAENEVIAINYILNILKDKNAKTVVKSKSMTTEEIHFNENLDKFNIESIETDLGEFIVQKAGEPPYHIVTPAMHKSKEDVAILFNDLFKTKLDSTPEELTLFVRNFLRKKYTTADIGVTGANFLIADNGGISITENEGNAFMSVAFPKTHIVIAGIEKMIPSILDLHYFLPLLATSGTGQSITAYNSIIFGSKSEEEVDGPSELYIILLDNRRSELFEDMHLKNSLKCIRCGACLNACPIYKNIGGYTYNSTYSGPIGSIITPVFKGYNKYSHLSYASTLCGKCAEVCPVKIELNKLLLYNRDIYVRKHSNNIIERIIFGRFKNLMLNVSFIEIFSAKLKNSFLKIPLNNLWGVRRSTPKISNSFRNRYLLTKKRV